MKKPNTLLSKPATAETIPASRVPEAPTRSARVASLVNLVAFIGGAVLLAAMSGPKLPKGTGE